MNRISNKLAGDRIALLTLGLMGAVSLVYQVTWTRQLTTLLGSTVTAVALITSMFMVGMALGAWLIGRLADKRSSHLRLLGMLSAGLGLTGALAVPMYAVVDRFYTRGGFDSSPTALLGLGVLLACFMTLAPTAFVGAGFPVVSRTLALHRRDITSGASSGYVAGTTGSVLGALGGGLLLVPSVGVSASILASSLVVVVAGALTFAAGRRDPHGTPDNSEPTPARQSGDPESHVTRRPALVVFVLSGASIMVYETVWTRELLLIFGASVYAVATMLAAVLTGLAIGQWLGGRNAQAREDSLGTLGLLQLAGGGAAMLSLLLTRLVPLAYHVARSSLPGGPVGFIFAQFLLTFLVMAVPCILLGATAPIAVRLSTSERAVLGQEIGSAYAFNTAGAVAGSLLGGLLLVPLATTVGAAGFAALLNVIAAVVALRVALPRTASTALRRRMVSSIAVASVGFASLLTAYGASLPLALAVQPANTSVSAEHFLEVSKVMTAVYSKDAPQGRVTVFETPDGTRSLHVSGMNEGALLPADIQTMETIIHLPTVIIGDVSDVLVVGLGTGMTSDLALHSLGSPQVDTVEINPAVVEASRYFVDEPIDARANSTVIIDDARHLYATIDKRYDMIVSEPSHPLSTYAARMFTRESFEVASRILESDGAMLQWLPAYLMEQEDLDMMVKTFGTVFPNTYVWATLNPDQRSQRLDYMLIGLKNDRTLDPEQIIAELEEEYGDGVLLEHVYSPEDVAAILQDDDVPLNTDDLPVFEYRMPVRYLRWIWG